MASQIVRLGVGIMAHHARVEEATKLLIEQEVDCIVIDIDDQGENPTGNEVWTELSGMDTDWSVVLQDDALPVPEFRRHASAALAHAPQTAVSFYVGTSRPRPTKVMDAIDEADKVGATWLRADTLLWGVAVAMPTAHLAAYLEWSNRATHFPYDTRIGQWYLRQGIEVYYSWPSLVDHADGVSLVHADRARLPRKAHRLGVPESGWDDTVVRIRDAGSR